MRFIGLMVTPGDGYRSVEVSEGMTVAQLVESQNLYGRAIMLDGQAIDGSAFKSTTLDGVVEVWAVGAVKGA